MHSFVEKTRTGRPRAAPTCEHARPGTEAAMRHLVVALSVAVTACAAPVASPPGGAGAAGGGSAGGAGAGPARVALGPKPTGYFDFRSMSRTGSLVINSASRAFVVAPDGGTRTAALRGERVTDDGSHLIGADESGEWVSLRLADGLRVPLSGGPQLVGLTAAGRVITAHRSPSGEQCGPFVVLGPDGTSRRVFGSASASRGALLGTGALAYLEDGAVVLIDLDGPGGTLRFAGPDGGGQAFVQFADPDGERLAVSWLDTAAAGVLSARGTPSLDLAPDWSWLPAVRSGGPAWVKLSDDGLRVLLSHQGQAEELFVSPSPMADLRVTERGNVLSWSAEEPGAGPVRFAAALAAPLGPVRLGAWTWVDLERLRPGQSVALVGAVRQQPSGEIEAEGLYRLDLAARTFTPVVEGRVVAGPTRGADTYFLRGEELWKAGPSGSLARISAPGEQCVLYEARDVLHSCGRLSVLDTTDTPVPIVPYSDVGPTFWYTQQWLGDRLVYGDVALSTAPGGALLELSDVLTLNGGPHHSFYGHYRDSLFGPGEAGYTELDTATGERRVLVPGKVAEVAPWARFDGFAPARPARHALLEQSVDGGVVAWWADLETRAVRAVLPAPGEWTSVERIPNGSRWLAVVTRHRSPQPPRRQIMERATGALVDVASLDGDYWAIHSMTLDGGVERLVAVTGDGAWLLDVEGDARLRLGPPDAGAVRPLGVDEATGLGWALRQTGEWAWWAFSFDVAGATSSPGFAVEGELPFLHDGHVLSVSGDPATLMAWSLPDGAARAPLTLGRAASAAVQRVGRGLVAWGSAGLWWLENPASAPRRLSSTGERVVSVQSDGCCALVYRSVEAELTSLHHVRLPGFQRTKLADDSDGALGAYTLGPEGKRFVYEQSEVGGASSNLWLVEVPAGADL